MEKKEALGEKEHKHFEEFLQILKFEAERTLGQLKRSGKDEKKREKVASEFSAYLIESILSALEVDEAKEVLKQKVADHYKVEDIALEQQISEFNGLAMNEFQRFEFHQKKCSSQEELKKEFSRSVSLLIELTFNLIGKKEAIQLSNNALHSKFQINPQDQIQEEVQEKEMVKQEYGFTPFENPRFTVFNIYHDSFQLEDPLKKVDCSYATPDNKFLAVMSDDYTKIKIFNIVTRKKVAEFQVEASFWLGLRSLNGTEDSKFIFFQIQSGIVQQWECATQSFKTFYEHQDVVLDIVTTMDSQQMYCSTESYCYKWNLEKHELHAKIPHPEANFIYMLLSPDDKTLYSNAYGPFVFHFEVKSGPEAYVSVNKFDIVKDPGWVHFQMTFDKKLFIQTSQYNGSFWVCSLQDQLIEKVLSQNSAMIDFVALTYNGEHLVTRSDKETVIWKVSNWMPQVIIKEDVCIITSANRYCNALVINGQYYSFSENTLTILKEKYK